MSKKLTVLCAATHPDDIELQCAGTLIRYKEGHKVYMAVACESDINLTSLYAELIDIYRQIYPALRLGNQRMYDRFRV